MQIKHQLKNETRFARSDKSREKENEPFKEQHLKRGQINNNTKKSVK